eukprot:TRINITY_DN5460_c0_g1_i2.p1 TRINITY_DN5460_c0_g1~~TRINITY_DN5460_c0_g1_i2.p1  ORF type:complete len:779 (-),score=140.16 TRINITY_DN5460_c0_g1_i2:91-2427(-)
MSEWGDVFGFGVCGEPQQAGFNELSISRVSHLQEIRVTAGSVGLAHAALVSDTGHLYTFGKGKYGRLGNGYESNNNYPMKVSGVLKKKRVVKVSCGAFHTAVVTSNGELYTFGRNDSGQLGVVWKNTPSTTTTAKTDVSNLPHYNLPNKDKEKEKQEEIPLLTEPQMVNFFSGRVVQNVACGTNHTLISLGRGELYGFGDNSFGQVGVIGEKKYFAPVKVSLELSGVEFGAPVSLISCGSSFSAVVAGRKLCTWGKNDKGQCGQGFLTEFISAPALVPTLAKIDIRSVSCGLEHMGIVSQSDGAVYMWGSNSHAQLGFGDILNTVLVMSAQESSSSTQTPFCVNPRQVKEALFNKRCYSLSCGSYHTAVLTEAREVFTFGLGDFGQLGNNVASNASSPYHVRLPAHKGEHKPLVAFLEAGGRFSLCGTIFKPLVTISSGTFKEDTDQILAFDNYSDIQIIANGNERTKAHKIMLSRSEQLQNLIKDLGQELPLEVDPVPLALALNYLYKGDFNEQAEREFLNKAGNIVPIDFWRQIVKASESLRLEYLRDYSLRKIQTLSGAKDVVPALVPLPHLGDHLSNFVNKDLFHDIVFTYENSGVQEYVYAHKVILAGRCERFRNEFSGNFAESKMAAIPIDGILDATNAGNAPTGVAFKRMLYYLYTGNIGDNWLEENPDVAVDLLMLSNEYGLDHLKQCIESFMVTNAIDVENVSSLFQLANTYEATQLKAFCEYFIMCEIDNVAMTEGWKNLDSELAQQITSKRKPVSENAGKDGKCTLQ